jgi:GntR family transcriptional regulator, transcriptional repressor for pyruvate dehydrogenase complex
MNNITDVLFERLQSEILGGTYRIGTRLPSEREISERYGVSRITARDAVSRLCQTGLLNRVPQSGTFVNDYLTGASMDLLIRIMQSTNTIDGEMLFSLLELRRANEVFAARLAALNITKEGADELADLAERGLAGIDDIVLLCDCDYEIHRAVITHSGNRVLPLLFNSFKPVYRHYVEFFYRLPGAGAFVMPLYRKLASACASRDGDYAAHIMERILVYAENRVKDALAYGNDNAQVSLAAFRNAPRA